MSITNTTIARGALARLGDRYQLNSLDEATPAAKAVKEVFEGTRDAVLREYPWGFAKTYLHPSQLQDIPPTPAFQFAYLYPADCLKILSVKDFSWVEAQGAYALTDNSGYYDIAGRVPQLQNAGYVEYDIMQGNQDKRIIATNCGDIQLCYTRRVDNPNDWDSGFQLAFTYWLASEIAVTLTGSLEAKGRMRTEARRAIERAAEVSANEQNYPNRFRDASWMSARGSRGYTDYGDY